MVVESSRDIPEAEVEIFKALGDPIRWNIITAIAVAGELPCASLEDKLPIAKPTISYHTKILQQAGLLAVRKEGRNSFYTLRGEILEDIIDSLGHLAPRPRPVSGENRTAPAERRPGRRSAAGQPARRRENRIRRAAGDDDVVVLTW